MNAAAKVVIHERTFLPPDLRAALDEWVIKTVPPRAGRRLFGIDPERVELDELLAFAGEPVRRREALDRSPPLPHMPLEADLAAFAVAMTDPDRRVGLFQQAHDAFPTGFLIAATLDRLPERDRHRCGSCA